MAWYCQLGKMMLLRRISGLGLLALALLMGGMNSPLRAAVEVQVSKQHYTSNGREIEILSYTPQDGKKAHRPIIVLYGSLGDQKDAGTRGITEHYCQTLAALGYQVYADHYLSFFQGQLPQNNKNATHAMEAKDLAQIEQTIRDGIQALRVQDNLDPGAVALLGFSFGATLSMDMAATQPDIAALVDFYGKVYPWIKNRPVQYKTPTLVLQGELDTEAPVANAEELRAFFKAHGIIHDVHIYPGVGHTFNANPTAPISLDAQKRVLAFLAKFYPIPQP